MRLIDYIYEVDRVMRAPQYSAHWNYFDELGNITLHAMRELPPDAVAVLEKYIFIAVR